MLESWLIYGWKLISRVQLLFQENAFLGDLVRYCSKTLASIISASVRASALLFVHGRSLCCEHDSSYISA